MQQHVLIDGNRKVRNARSPARTSRTALRESASSLGNTNSNNCCSYHNSRAASGDGIGTEMPTNTNMALALTNSRCPGGGPVPECPSASAPTDHRYCLLPTSCATADRHSARSLKANCSSSRSLAESLAAAAERNDSKSANS